LTDCAFRLDPVRGSGEVTGIAESQGWVVEHGIGQELVAAGSSRRRTGRARTRFGGLGV